MTLISSSLQITIQGGETLSSTPALSYQPSAFITKSLIEGSSGNDKANRHLPIFDTCSATLAHVTQSLSDINLNAFVRLGGGTVNMSALKWFLLRNKSTTSGENIIFGNNGGGTNGFIGFLGDDTHTITVKPGEEFLITSAEGWSCTAGANLLRLRAATGTPAYELYLLGFGT